MRIELAGVTKRFGRVTALDGVTVTVPEGSRVGLIGPNGSGKSTLTRVMMGMMAVEGEVRIGGLSPFTDRVRLARHLAYVPQAAPRFGAKVGDLIRAVAAVRALPAARLVACAARLDLDVAAIASRPFHALSGGMRQKLLIALALAVDATLLIMDEPTAGLDVGARQRFFSLFEELPASTTLVLCSHRLEELQHLIDRVVVLEEGRLAYHGPLEEFLGQRATSVVELRSVDATRTQWLRAHGFAPGAGNWWAKTIARGSKEEEIGLLASAMHGDLADLLVRDVETVDARGGAC
jgi:ABC-type multidrug transport system ATPase subunit